MMESVVKWLFIALIAAIVSTSAVKVSENLISEAQADTEPRYYQLMERQTRALEEIAGELGQLKQKCYE